MAPEMETAREIQVATAAQAVELDFHKIRRRSAVRVRLDKETQEEMRAQAVEVQVVEAQAALEVFQAQEPAQLIQYQAHPSHTHQVDQEQAQEVTGLLLLIQQLIEVLVETQAGMLTARPVDQV